MPPTIHSGGSGAPLSPQSSRNGASQSRFLEGSMNDRISAAPPPSFLGPDQLAAYERQFYMQPPEQHSLASTANTSASTSSASGHAATRPPRPGSSAGQSLGHGKKASTGGSWFAPLWDGVKERLHLNRSRSSCEIATGTEKEEDKERKRGQTMPVPIPMGPPPAMREPGTEPGPGLYPSREEVLESYKSLVSSGFFSAHAIHGTRHPLPQTQAPRSGPAHEVVLPPPTRAAPPPPPPAPTKPFAQHMAAHQKQQQHQVLRKPSSSSRPSPSTAPAFSSIPYISTRPPTAVEQERLRTTGARPAIPTEFRELSTQPSRGTKRGPPVDTETHARKLVKKLRKSASRLSVDLSLQNSRDSSKPRAAASAPSSATSASPPSNTLDQPPRESTGTVKSAQTMPAQRTPTKLKKRGLFVGRRHHSATYRPRSAGRNSGPQPPPLPMPQLALPDLPSPTDTESQSPSGRTSLSLGGLPVPNLQPGRTSQDSRTGRLSQDSRTRVHEDLDVMDLDSPRCSRSMSRSVSPDKQLAGGLAPPSFHYPYRTRTVPNEPLSVVPDVNRGIPVVPKIPAHYKGKLREVSNRDSGVASAEGGMMGDENYEVSWYRV